MSDYGSTIGLALPGCLGDSGDYNIDGACFVEEFEHEISMIGKASARGEVIAGKIVNVVGVEDGYKKISSVFTDAGYDIAYGVVLRDSFGYKVDPTGLSGYNPGDPVSIVTHGRVWVLTTTIQQAPTPFAHVYVTDEGYAAASGDFEIYGWSFTGGYTKLSGNFHLVEVQVKQSTGHMQNLNKVKVNGIHLIKSSEGNLKYNTEVYVTAEVSPKNATNKRGTWHLDDEGKGTIEEVNEQQIKFTPTRSFIGDVHITWVATDGSGVQGMVEITYIP